MGVEDKTLSILHTKEQTNLLTFDRRNAICFVEGIRLYRALNTFHHSYKNQSINDVYSKGRCLFRDTYKTQRTASVM